MPRQKAALVAFNRGLVSPLALARVDIKRLALSAEQQTNWIPRALGPMKLRPGWQYLTTTVANGAARCIPFVFATSDVARIEFTNLVMRVFVNDVQITRPSVSTLVVNGGFDVGLASWTDNDEGGTAASVWVAGGYMGLTGDGTNAAVRDQLIGVAVADQGVEHALRITIHRGPVMLRVGTAAGDDNYVTETTLDTGVHSLAFTPTGNVNIRFFSRLKRQVLVNSCTFELAEEMQIPSPYPTAALGTIVAGLESQSADVVYVACDGYQQRKIERRSTRSWSLATFYSDDGPFRIPNTSPVTITPSALAGNITMTASRALFRSSHVGALWRLTSAGQTVSLTIAAQNTFTNAIEVTGVDAQRVFTREISGLTATGSTVTVQRSLVSDTGPWTDYTGGIVADASVAVDDGLDNQIVWYRMGVKTGDYVAGNIVCSIYYLAGSVDGIARITAWTSATVVDAEVLTDLGGTAATDDWAEGQWSDYRGWPTAGCLYEGRLWWAGRNGINGSVSDAFDSNDANVEGDSGEISRMVGSGPVDVINWMLPLLRLILGTEGSEISARSTTFDEPLSPTNLNLKPASTQGSAAVQAGKVDSHGIFVQRGGTRVFELALSGEAYDYASTELSILIPEIGQPLITRMAVQRQPDTRVHFVRSDGTAAILIYNKAENLVCWIEIETDGLIEDVSVLPGASGSEEDQVYYVIARTINGSTVRYHEKWAKESECVGGTLNKQADAFVVFTNSPASVTVTGLSHLIGETVVVWQDGICPDDADGNIQTYVVSAAGTITLGTAATTGVVGLAYTADFKSAKLGHIEGALAGSSLTGHQKIDSLGLLLANTHARGIQYGQDFDHLDGLPTMENGAPVDADSIWSAYDQPGFSLNGTWDSDARLCLRAKAPRTATVIAAIVGVYSGG